MILLVHILVAVTSIGVSAWAFAKPTDARIKGSYGLIGGTIASGVLLVVAGGSVLHACVMGLLFVSVATGLTVASQRKLAASTLEK